MGLPAGSVKWWNLDSSDLGLTVATWGKVAIAGGRKTSRLVPIMARSTALVREPEVGMNLALWRARRARGGRMRVGILVRTRLAAVMATAR